MKGTDHFAKNDTKCIGTAGGEDTPLRRSTATLPNIDECDPLILNYVQAVAAASRFLEIFGQAIHY